MSEYIVYTKPECPNCDKAKQLLDLHKKSYRTVVLGVDIPVAEFKLANPGVRTMPFVTCEKREFTSILGLASWLVGKERGC